jgi:hypothetical protein
MYDARVYLKNYQPGDAVWYLHEQRKECVCTKLQPLYCKIQDFPLLYSKLQVQFLVFSEMSYYFHVNLQTADFCQYRFYCNLLVFVMISASNIF